MTNSIIQKLRNARERKKPSSLYFLTSVFAGGNIVSSLLKMVGGILTARVIEPSVLGLFNGMGLVLGYVPFLQLGILNGLSRELPYFIGKGDQLHVRELTAAAQAWALLVGGFVTFGLMIVAIWQGLMGHLNFAIGWVTFAFSAMLLFYAQHYLQVTYRTHHDFARLALIRVTGNGIALVLVVTVWLFSFYGLCLRTVLVGLADLGLLWTWRPIKVWPKWNTKHLLHLLKIGAPIFGVGQLWALWVVLDSTLVLKFLGTRGLGLYAIALMAGQAMQQLPNALTEITYPRMAEQYGRTGKIRDLLTIANKPILFMALGMAPIVLIGWSLIPPITHFLLPRYVEGISAAQWSLVPAYLMSFIPVFNVFNIMKRQGLYSIAIAMGMASYFGSLLWFVRDEVYLAAFPQATAIGRGVYVIVCYFFVAHLWRQESQN